MKNLFFIINKEKIYAYVVSIMTIVTIFLMTSIMNSKIEDTEEVSTNNIENNSTIENNEENTQNSAIGEAIPTSVPN